MCVRALGVGQLDPKNTLPLPTLAGIEGPSPEVPFRVYE